MDNRSQDVSAAWIARLSLAFRDGAVVPGTASRRVYTDDGTRYHYETIQTTYRLRCREFGEVELPTGRIAISCVPMDFDNPAVAVRRVAPGHYRVWATVGTSDEADIEEHRFGVFVGVHVSSARIARWERAELVWLDARPFEPNVHGDADLWSETWYIALLDAARVLPVCDVLNACKLSLFDLRDALRSDSACPTVATVLSPDPRGKDRIVLFSSSTPCTMFWALDAAGNPCQFVIDTGFLGENLEN